MTWCDLELSHHFCQLQWCYTIFIFKKFDCVKCLPLLLKINKQLNLPNVYPKQAQFETHNTSETKIVLISQATNLVKIPL